MSQRRGAALPHAAEADDAQRGGVPAEAWLAAAALPALLERLRHARTSLALRTVAGRADALDRVATLWLEDRQRLEEAAGAIARSTGYAQAMVALCLRRTFSAWRGAALRALLAEATQAAPHGDGDPGAGGGAREPRGEHAPRDTHGPRTVPSDRPTGATHVATPAELVVVILAQNTPGLAIAPVFSALGLGAAVLVKSSRGEPSFAPRLSASIAEVDPELGQACAAHCWAGGDAAIEERVLAAASRVVVYGSSAAIAAVRARAGERTVAHGPRVSLAVVGAAAAADGSRAETTGEAAVEIPAGFPQRQAAALAREIAFLDQRGCLSPQAVLIDARLDRVALGQHLARELAALECEWPRRRLSIGEAAELRRRVDEAEAEVIAGRALALHGGSGQPWAVVVERDSTLRPAPLDRFVRLIPFRDSAGLRALLRPLHGVLECAGIDAPEPARARLARACRAAGAARVCAIEAMQSPPADWHAGGRPPLEGLLGWCADELDPALHPAPGTELAPAPSAGSLGTEGAGRGTDLHDRFLRHVAQTSEAPRGIEVVRASGSWVYDAQGRAWLDLLAGIGVAALGHAHPAVTRAIVEQAGRYAHVMVYGEDVLEPQVELASRLAALLSPPLSVVYFTSSGAEAIEGALKLARKATGRERVLSFCGAYHGDTTGALALGGNPFYRDPFLPLLPGAERLEWSSAAALEQIDERTAAVFAEPIQAEAGVRLPDPDFLPSLAARCREVGALLVLDEVVTGLGRTGRWFAFEHWPGAEPDVLVLAKALGGGLPLGAFVASPELMRALSHDPPLGHITTFGGNPVSCAAARATLEVLAAERLPERAARLGEGLCVALAASIGRGGLVAVRGLGLLIGLELASPADAQRFVTRCRERGVLLGWTLHHDRVVRLAPPLTITRDEIALALETVRSALGE